MTHNHYYNNHHQSSHSLPSTGKILRPIGFMTGWNIWKDGYKWVCKLREHYSYILRKPKVNQVICVNLFRTSPSRFFLPPSSLGSTGCCVLMPGSKNGGVSHHSGDIFHLVTVVPRSPRCAVHPNSMPSGELT